MKILGIIDLSLPNFFAGKSNFGTAVCKYKSPDGVFCGHVAKCEDFLKFHQSKFNHKVLGIKAKVMEKEIPVEKVS